MDPSGLPTTTGGKRRGPDNLSYSSDTGGLSYLEEFAVTMLVSTACFTVATNNVMNLVIMCSDSGRSVYVYILYINTTDGLIVDIERQQLEI